MNVDWLLPLIARPALVSRALHLMRRFRDLFTRAEIESLVDIAMARAIQKYLPSRGSFQTFATTFVDRALLRAVGKELAWKTRFATLDIAEPVDFTQHAESEAFRTELEALLGPDYPTYISHVAWRRSIREISRMERRSIRSVRTSVVRASRRVLESYGYETPRRGPARPPRDHRDCDSSTLDVSEPTPDELGSSMGDDET